MLALVAVGCLLVGCGGPYYRQVRGDSDGVPVRIEVKLARQFVRDLRNRGPIGRETVIYSRGFYTGWYGGYGRRGYCPPGHRYRYDPFWYSDVYWTDPAPTQTYLFGGDGPLQARLLRAELQNGDNIIDINVRPGRQVTLTLQAYGGLEGWEELTNFIAADRPGQLITLDCTEHPAHVKIINPDGTVLMSPTLPSGPPPSGSEPATTPEPAPQPKPATDAAEPATEPAEASEPAAATPDN